MNPIHIRLADLDSTADQESVRSLVDAYMRDPMGADEPMPAEIRHRMVDGLRSHSSGLAFLAFLEGQPIGLAVCFLGYSTFAGRPLMNVHDFMVLSDHRGKGVGTKMLQHLEAEARQRGCCKLTLEVRQDNHRAKALYRSRGFSAGLPSFEFWTKPLNSDHGDWSH